MSNLPALTKALAALLLGMSFFSPANAKTVSGDLKAGKCSSLGDATLCLNKDRWFELTVAGKKVDFNGGGAVSEAAEPAVAFEMTLNRQDYRVKISDWSLSDVDFARFSEIQFRKVGQRFFVTKYTTKSFDTECEPGVDYGGQIDFANGRTLAWVDNWKPRPVRTVNQAAKLPDLYEFRFDDLESTYQLYSGLADVTKMYCEKRND